MVQTTAKLAVIRFCRECAALSRGTHGVSCPTQKEGSANAGTIVTTASAEFDDTVCGVWASTPERPPTAMPGRRSPRISLACQRLKQKLGVMADWAVLVVGRLQGELKPASFVSPNTDARKLPAAIVQHGFADLPERHKEQLKNAIVIPTIGLRQAKAKVFRREAT